MYNWKDINPKYCQKSNHLFDSINDTVECNLVGYENLNVIDVLYYLSHQKNNLKYTVVQGHQAIPNGQVGFYIKVYNLNLKKIVWDC